MMNIQQLASQLKVHPADVECFANLMCNDMKKDGIAEIFTTATPEQQIEFNQAYAKAAAKKTVQFSSAYLTKGREAFNAQIYAELV